MKKVQLITDGACIGNPGPGGWACILRCGQNKKEIFGSEPHTTNNRMELTAAVKGLAALREPCEVEIVTDSQYMKNGIQKWIANWKRNGWRTADKKPVRNVDLWQRLDTICARHKVRWHWLKGHVGHALNERADALAREAIAAVRAGARGALSTSPARTEKIYATKKNSRID